MPTTEYPPPVDRLLTLGDPRDLRDLPDWPDYQAPGIGPEHIPELIRMATDEEFFEMDSENIEVWAPIHAWRALGQLQAAAAAEPLLGLLRRIDDEGNDWVGEELPEVFGMIGPAAIPALAAYLADGKHGLYARIAAASALQEIGERHPEARDRCVAVLTGQLERFAEQDPDLNGFLISFLVKMKAVESAPVMERAFVADAVEETIMGDWEDAQVSLGLKPARERPRRRSPLQRALLGSPPEPAEEEPEPAPRGAPAKPRVDRAAKAKAKRKQANQSRRKNRKR